MTLFKALTGGAFDRLNWQHTGEVDQHFSKKLNAPGFARGGAWAVLELTGTLVNIADVSLYDSNGLFSAMNAVHFSK